jgi:hypothetical protein
MNGARRQSAAGDCANEEAGMILYFIADFLGLYEGG